MPDLKEIFEIATNPSLLLFPSPLLAYPANWVIPGLVWLVLLRSFFKILKDPSMVWGWQHMRRLTLKFGAWLSKETTYPGEHPMGELLAAFLSALLNYLFAIYFFVFGMSVLGLSIAALLKQVWGAVIAYMLVAMVLLIAGRFYRVMAIRDRLKAVGLWREYKNKTLGGFSVVAMSVACVGLSVALMVNSSGL